MTANSTILVRDIALVAESKFRRAFGFAADWSGVVSRGSTTIILFACAGALGGCSPIVTVIPLAGLTVVADGGRVDCRETIINVRQFVVEAGVADAEATVIPGFPIFRVTRLLAKLGERFGSGASGQKFHAWVDRLHEADEKATHYEVLNLPVERYRRLSYRLFGSAVGRDRLFDKWRSCSRRVGRALLADARSRRNLVAAAKVPENYSEAARIAGAFPIMSIPVAAGWERWKAENLPSFNRRVSDLSARGHLVEFAPSDAGQQMRASEVRDMIRRAGDPFLKMPAPKGRELQRLFQTFAPRWTIDVTGPYDLPGHPAWNDSDEVVVDVERPTVFTRISHAVIGGQILLQLNYSIWFKERPRQSAVDLLGGRLDGIIWRVTLGLDGKPLIYDSIHVCGCYHLLFPVRAPHRRSPARKQSPLRERPAILNLDLKLTSGQALELRVASATHYLQAIGVGRARRGGRVRRHYRLASEDDLRSLPRHRGDRRSLFGADGIVPGTERLERLLLWPTGVLSPGAMRQWGHHAVAFAEKRHFDEPTLFETLLGW